MTEIRNILVATDFGPAADAALDFASDLALTKNAQLRLLYVQEDIAARYGRYVPAITLPNVQQDIESAAHAKLNALIDRTSRSGLSVEGILIRSLSIADCIADYAADQRIDLIALGTHGREGVSHFLLGSVAERVVRLARCSVLTVRAAATASTT